MHVKGDGHLCVVPLSILEAREWVSEGDQERSEHRRQWRDAVTAD